MAPRRPSKRIVATAALLAAAAPMFGQVVARQGAPRFDPEKVFESPMILEIPSRPLTTLPPGGRWTVPSLREYRCEDAWIPTMTITRIDKGKGGPIRFKVEGIVMVAESFDRFVTLRVHILDGARGLAGVASPRFEAEEAKLTNFEFKLDLAEAAAASFAASTDPKLQVRVDLQKDRAGYYIPADQTLVDQRAPTEVTASPPSAKPVEKQDDLCTEEQRRGMAELGLSESQIEAACFLR